MAQLQWRLSLLGIQSTSNGRLSSRSARTAWYTYFLAQTLATLKKTAVDSCRFEETEHLFEVSSLRKIKKLVQFDRFLIRKFITWKCCIGSAAPPDALRPCAAARVRCSCYVSLNVTFNIAFKIYLLCHICPYFNSSLNYQHQIHQWQQFDHFAGFCFLPSQVYKIHQ